ncbi:common pilus major fimbrillin subunit EcpA [Moellerella wisconsensis]|nr:common pilus major fimbrillin subunit EcpA [Moellerella wisconsensis]UNH25672.1 common pilus major fimbrillin subunit EcpA [Moellerella wisconsensis]
MFGAVSMANAAERTATATATWQATAIKDTKSMLVVTPLKSLTFNYAEGQKSFNQQEGAFDIAIQGQETATDFQLTAKVVTNTLTRTTDDSQLTVGVKWNGTSLSQSQATTLIDFSQGITAGLDTIGQQSAFATAARATDRGSFNFVIASAKSDSTTDATFEELADGVWDGDVKVQFTAVWTLP